MFIFCDVLYRLVNLKFLEYFLFGLEIVFFDFFFKGGKFWLILVCGICFGGNGGYWCKKWFGFLVCMRMFYVWGLFNI